MSINRFFQESPEIQKEQMIKKALDELGNGLHAKLEAKKAELISKGVSPEEADKQIKAEEPKLQKLLLETFEEQYQKKIEGTAAAASSASQRR